MERLIKELGPESIKVLVVNNDVLLLLIGNRHVKYHKNNLSIKLDGRNKLTTKIDELTPADVVSIVKELVPDLVEQDIDSIELSDNDFIVTISQNSLFYHGTFTIKHID